MVEIALLEMEDLDGLGKRGAVLTLINSDFITGGRPTLFGSFDCVFGNVRAIRACRSFDQHGIHAQLGVLKPVPPTIESEAE